MTHDHALVGALIEHEYELYFPTKTAFARELKIERSSIYRVLKGDFRMKPGTWRRAEVLLDLPRGFLDAVREQDATAIADSGAREDVVAWVLDQIRDTPTSRNREAQ